MMRQLEQGNYPHGELMMERDHARRWAERDGRYSEVFSSLNPA
jgi:uncharacterized oxidoreductase